MNITGTVLDEISHDIAKAGVEKLITFEFSHFTSPNSMYPSARQLFNKYKEIPT